MDIKMISEMKEDVYQKIKELKHYKIKKQD
jgi:hypothetical protein